jgi:site-specific DNA-methyltransferase (adenine-specific)
MGSGTTAKVSIKLNRNFVGSEISEEYYEVANKRINQNNNTNQYW